MIKNRKSLLGLILPTVIMQLVASQMQTSYPTFNVYARFDPVSGGLIYDILDKYAHTIQRIEKFFPVPPIPQCS